MSEQVTERKIGFDVATLDTAKPIVDDDNLFAMPAIIASEIVQQYSDGYAYKPADELRKMVDVANLIGARPVKILEHPGADTNYLLLRQSDVHGVVKNFVYTKDLMDPKTKRPCRRGVKADVYWFKERVPKITLDAIRSGQMLDVSIGFTFDRVQEPGDFEGQHYDYRQTNMYLDHLAAPIPAGRCPGPICGIGYDASAITLDAAVLESCPVCRHMVDAGWVEAGRRLYKTYGPDVLEVIDTGVLPEKPKPKETSLDEDFRRVLGELNKHLSSSS